MAEDEAVLRTFERIVAAVDPPSYVVTAVSADGERGGCYVGFATQCSILPSRFAVCLSKLNHTYRVATSASALVVHVLRHGDGEMGRRFGSQTGDEVDKFAGVVWHPGPGGAPVVEGLDWFGGPILLRHDVGDHVLFVIEPEAGECRRPTIGAMRTDELGPVDPGHPIAEEIPEG